MKDLRQILSSLDIPYPASKIYKELLESGENTPATLSKKLNIKRTSVYDYLKLLKSKGLILEKDVDNKTYFLVGNINDVEFLIKEQIKKQKENLEDFLNIKNNLDVKETSQAKIKFFDNKENLKLVLYNTLFTREKVLYSLWPYSEMLEVLGRKDLEEINVSRINKNIKLKVIWPHKVQKLKSHIWDKLDKNLERRYAPADSKFSMGYIAYDDKVAFISSKAEGYAFVVESREFAELTKMQFEKLWEVSRK